MARGKKHTCSSCNKAFYDLGKTPIVCPSCGTIISQKKTKYAAPSNTKSQKLEEGDDTTRNEVIVIGYTEDEVIRDDKKKSLVFAAKILGLEKEVQFCGALSEIFPGGYFVASGNWMEETKHSLQFSYEYIGWLSTPPLRGIETFLCGSEFKGIGPVLSKKIVDQLGTKSMDVLNNNHSRLSTIDGITSDNISIISQQWLKFATKNSLDIFLTDLGLRGRARSIIGEIPKEKILKIVFESPYSLIENVSGIGFRTADEIAIRLGVKRESINRTIAGIEFAMSNAAQRDGHCGMPLRMLIKKTSELLGTDEPTVEAIIHDGHASGFLSMESSEEEKFCFLSKLHSWETGILDKIKLFTKSEPALNKSDIAKALSKLDGEFDFPLSETQKIAIQSSFDSNFSVITGGPGVGKTTIIKGLVRTLKEAKINFALCAPTGRAAKRLGESSEEEALTIHRLLEFLPGSSFQKNSKNLLKQNALICDESSMIDVELMYALFDALDPGTTIILIGDIDQLPPVGPGQPFRDIINSGIVNINYLQENFRQNTNSGIVHAAVKVNSGHFPEVGTDINTDDFHVISRTGSANIISGVKEFLEKLPGLRGGKYNSFTDVQILTPMNKGDLGTSNLNTIVQAILNPNYRNGVKLFKHMFSPGDKVIQIKNNYKHNVFNGDIGRIIECNLKDQFVKVSFDGQTVTYKKSEMSSNLSLAYAISIHKSQGSEYPVVILIVTNEHHFMLARNLVYTGITRGRELVFVIGEKEALSSAARKNRNTKRLTLLSQRLNEENL